MSYCTSCPMEIPSLLDVLKFSYSKNRDVVLYNIAAKPDSELYYLLETTSMTYGSYDTKVVFGRMRIGGGIETHLHAYCNSEEEAIRQFKTCLGSPDYFDPDLVPDPVAMLHILIQKGHSITESRKFIRKTIDSIVPPIFKDIYEKYKATHISYSEFDKNIATWLSPGVYSTYPLEIYRYLGTDKGTKKLLSKTK